MSETPSVQVIVAETLRQIAGWPENDRGEYDLHVLADQVVRNIGWSCGLCRQVECDSDCPLRWVRPKLAEPVYFTCQVTNNVTGAPISINKISVDRVMWESWNIDQRQVYAESWMTKTRIRAVSEGITFTDPRDDPWEGKR